MIKKALLLFVIFLFCLLEAGFFPPTLKRTIKSVDGNKVILSKPLPVKGMSGVVLRKFGKMSAVSAILIQNSKNRAIVRRGDLLANGGLPSPKIAAKAGDKVIGGYLYNNVLVIAPNAKTYIKVIQSARRFWIHPDLYFAFLAREGGNPFSKGNLAKFARQAQVGLVYIVQKRRAILLDPISGQVVGSRAFKPVGSKARYPFYTRFGSHGAKGDYYQSVGAIR